MTSQFYGVPEDAVAEWLALRDARSRFTPSCAVDADAWFEVPKNKAASKVHRAEITLVCSRCPISKPCLAYALAANERYGCWGGVWMDRPSERRRFTNDSREAA